MTTRTDLFRKLHRDPILLLPNAWDAVSARLMQRAGFPAVATSSAAIAWTMGYDDGEEIPFQELLYLTGRILSAVSVPLTVDLEAGFGGTPEEIAGNTVALARLGVAGVNIEDSDKAADGQLRPLARQTEIIAAMRAALDRAGLDLFINARTDLFWLGLESDDARLAVTIERCRAFAAAGADGVFVPGLTDPGQIRRLTEAVDRPLNILAFHNPGGALLSGLKAAGVARVSVGSGAFRRIAADIEVMARAMKEEDNLDQLFDGPIPYAALQALMTEGR